MCRGCVNMGTGVWEILKNISAFLGVVIAAFAVYKLLTDPGLKRQKLISTVEGLVADVKAMEKCHEDEYGKGRLDDVERRVESIEKEGTPRLDQVENRVEKLERFREIEDAKREQEAVNRHTLEEHTKSLMTLIDEIKKNSEVVLELKSTNQIFSAQLITISSKAEKAESKADAANIRIDSLSMNISKLCRMIERLLESIGDKALSESVALEIKQVIEDSENRK